MNEAGADRVEKYRAKKCVYNGDNDDDEKFVCSYVYDFGRSVPYGETYFVDAALPINQSCTYYTAHEFLLYKHCHWPVASGSKVKPSLSS